MTLMSATACSFFFPGGRHTPTEAVWWMTATGTGLTLFVGEFCFFQAANIRVSLKSNFRAAFRHGLLAPITRNVCATARR
jgi:hypothetical protein